MKLAFVILNYGTYRETCECVTSIQEHIHINMDEYNITIVDNCSSDNSFEKLKKSFCCDNIDFLQNEENLGFARGNNVGIKYVNQKYKPEFIVVLNSDTEIFQDDLYYKLKQEYAHSEFALLGPMITLANGRCDDSPWKPIDRKYIEKELKRYQKEIKQLENGTYYFFKAIKFIQKIFLHKNKNSGREHGDFWRYQTQVELQGAFLVFSQKAFNYIDGFDPRTFLYYEEQLLYLSLIRAGQTIVYDPRISIYHKDGMATKNIRATTKNKMRILNKYNLESLEILLAEMNKQ